jgi:ribosomal protein S18 acetylase RimI-like enzyme
VPAILLAKLALGQHFQGQHLGEQLLLDALSRCVAAGELVGSRFVVVDAIDDRAAKFYAKYGFAQVPGTAPARLLRRLSAIAADLSQ